jgi:4-aminobutyrate aminotransferase-like enzyme
MSGPEGDFLDCANNVAGVGHSHPKVVEAGVKELQNIQVSALEQDKNLQMHEI